ncbi:RNA polymerase, sigma 28 subunit, FliA/WhiG subfamily [Pseudonocardia dioxanivorans CB1190]|uniref:RNA polymerase, sigma 28 subunit, FliA/WhiG subfamily n=1 Tax=Pseudonocardia dioxanivorans (strain ATCC 55486 / DSM 44775 / JCM 13855 / CB1190) TaxID=675635 RepID=F4CU99_PSEUX|nr:sigma-70 family RNA polymerase sigma factor [Pseudonocardia dioxanivorans]AEA24558.1 RNA polymerase, sigma 28 subunit, FliA/WhiG subfamily [Pseudonocardia dioxanivorans CB1190]
MRTLPAHRADPDVRPDGEFGDQLERLHRLARLPADDPARDALRDDLILTFLPVAERIAGRHASATPWSREDLRQAASEAVVRAVDRWDPERAQGDFLGYLVPCVRGEVLRWFRDQSWSVRVPRRLKELSVAIRSAHGPMAQRLGSAPRPSELARELGVDIEEVLEALHAEENHRAATLDAPAPGDERLPGEQLGEIDRQLELVEDAETLRPLIAALPERERRILLLRFYGGRTQSQIGEELGVSQMHVSRLLSRTLARLRAAMLDDTPPG